AADFVYFGNLPEVSFTQRNEFIHELKKGDITIVLNLGAKDVERSKEQLKNLLEDVDILILNGHEFAELVKAPFKDIHFQENVVSWYIPYLKGKIVVVTLGEKGSFLYSGDTIYHERAVKVDKIIDTTGAGDAYTSAFISKYVKTRNLKDSMQEGALYAAKILSKVGAN
ncbi:bifunctional hydroxymethylpyrimidine kinase/phosphomethylpyrimidine kinase, partial [Candidatus Roizmanbacteria bacterium]|nr:bifunctional hydroxymethylpyrimidine kinase/phosphomethylpyrimidine kinase [Candidatus Roizmanbacteria bacterium]